ncbi:MAG: efflux RND transporter permease subunit [Myxococcales bacterium]|nr:efflux RND transporter permease subunit [Myxococcales bacterium]
MITWFARNPIAANLLMLLVVGSGLVSLGELRQITYPDVAFDAIDVSVEYPGAAPEEIEESICVRIEEAIHDVDGIKRIRSRASEGRGNVSAMLALGADRRRVLEQVRMRVESLATLPAGARRPEVEELIDNSVLLGVVISGDADERTLRAVGERVRDDLARLPELNLVDLAGVRPYEISVEASERSLRRMGIGFDELANAVRSSSIDEPAGAIDTPAGEILVRAHTQARRGRDLEALPLLTRPDGTRLVVGDVARVIDGFADVDERASLDGRPAVVVRVLTRNNRNVLEASAAVNTYLDSARASFPDGLDLLVWNDESEELASRRALLVRNGLQGLVLVVLVLGVFLGARLAFWVTLGIPVAFLGALTVMGVLDVPISMITLFAFIVALGLVVDDAIVVGESVGAKQRAGADPLAAAIAGTHRVALPVTVAVVTTVFFVVPQLTAPGFFGKLVRPIGIVLIACLAFSLVESLLILPAHLVGSRSGAARASFGPLGWAARNIDAVHFRVDAALSRFIERRYLPLLERILSRPGLSVSLASVGAMFAFAWVAGGWLPFEFVSEVEGEQARAELEMPLGTPAEVTWATLRRIEREGLAIRKEIDEGRATSSFRGILTSLGTDPGHHNDFKTGPPGGHVGRVNIQLAPMGERLITSFELAQRWRERVGEVAGAVSLRFSGEGLIDDPPINLRLAANEPAALAAAVTAVHDALTNVPGVREVSDSHRPGKRELSLSVRPEAEAFGLTQAELTRQVRQAFHGEVVQSVRRGRDEIPIVVRYPPEERRSIANLESMWIETPGGFVPFSRVATAKPGNVAAVIHRSDRQRTVNVVADVDSSVTTAGEVLSDLEANLPTLLARWPGASFTRDGLNREEDEMLESRNAGMATALLVAYALLAVTLRSYRDPLLILVAIPFGIAGAIAAHVLLGLVLSGFSLIGMVALSGVVVNDSLVLVHAAKQQREQGATLREALCTTGAERFRPILLTSLTTFFGLTPLLFESSGQVEWLEPIGATLAFGVLFATVVTLLVVPAVWMLLDALGEAGTAMLSRRRPAPVARAGTLVTGETAAAG